jgi:D-alanyl-D-alanine carboxypeptidase
MRDFLLRLFAALLAFFLLSGCAPPTPGNAKEDLNQQLRYTLSSLPAAAGHWSAMIIALEAGDTLLDFRSHVAATPASLVKLLLADAAYHFLPEKNYLRLYSTEYNATDSSIAVLHVEAPGLPLDGDGNPDSLWLAIANDIRAQGVKKVIDRIQLRLPVHDSPLRLGWTMDDATGWYAPHAAILPAAGNLWRFTLQVEADTSYWRVWPESAYRPAHIWLEASEFSFRWQFGPYQIPFVEISSAQPHSPVTEFYIPMFAPHYVWAGQLQRALERVLQLPVENEFHFVNAELADGAKEIGRYATMPRDSMLRRLLHDSDNYIAGQLLSALAWQEHRSMRADSGLNVLADLLQQTDIQPEDYALFDASGLSRYNWIRPASLADYLHRRYYLRRLQDYLPNLGQNKRLQKRLGPLPPSWRLQGKTGSMRAVRNFAGFLYTDTNSYLVLFTCQNFTLAPVEIDAQMRRILRQLP